MGLSQKTEVFIIKLPVMTPTSQVLNGLAILHEGGGLMRKSLCVNSHKYMKATEPRFNRHNLFGEMEVDHSLHSEKLTEIGLLKPDSQKEGQSQ